MKKTRKKQGVQRSNQYFLTFRVMTGWNSAYALKKTWRNSAYPNVLKANNVSGMQESHGRFTRFAIVVIPLWIIFFALRSRIDLIQSRPGQFRIS